MDLVTLASICSMYGCFLLMAALFPTKNEKVKDVFIKCSMVCATIAFGIIFTNALLNTIYNLEEKENNIKTLKIRYLTEEGALDSIVIDMDSIRTYKKK